MTAQQRSKPYGEVTAAVSAVALALAGALLAGGCTERGAAADGRVGGDPLRAVRQSADALARAGSSRMRTAMEMTSGGTRVTVRGRGVFDYERRRGRLRVVLPQAEDRPITELYAPGELYMKNRGAGVPDDKWLRLDTTRLSDGNLVTNGATDPLTAAELLRGAREVTYAARQRIGGQRLLHYRGTTDIGSAAKAASPYARGSLAAAGGLAGEPVVFDAYLDERGRPHRVRHRFTLAGRQQVQVVSTTEVYDFGAPAKVALPGGGEIYSGTVESQGPAQ